MPPSITIFFPPRTQRLAITSASRLTRQHSSTDKLVRPQNPRRYAVPPAPKKRPAPADLFSLFRIPLSSFAAVVARAPGGAFPLPPAEYYSCVQRFVSELQRGVDPWSLSSSRAGDALKALPVDVIHATACILRHVHQPPSSDALATALWLFASDSSHRPATLSLARHLILTRAFGKLAPLRRAETRFNALVAAARDPDALTAEGERLLHQDSPAAAARVLARALHLSAAFEWEPHCRLALARAYLRAPQPGRGPHEARALFAELAGLGMPEAHLELARLLRHEDREKAEQHAYEAACAARPEAYSLLAEMSLERTDEQDDALRWAAEWSRLGDPKAEY